MTKFSQPMPRFDLQPRKAVSTLTPAPTEQANTTPIPVREGVEGCTKTPVDTCGTGPIEGRPGTAIWAHQGFTRFPPAVAVEMTQAGALPTNPWCSATQGEPCYDPGVASTFNSGLSPATAPQGIQPRFHPLLPNQSAQSLWTFQGTLPPKLVQGRYGEPILFREHNELPANNDNGKFTFGINTISTHEHNGHHGAENDGFTGAYFYPGQFYDYFWPIVLAGLNTINTAATDPKASTPDDAGGRINIPGDWHETMSTHWFHDHMFSFTSQNVYKGNAAMFNIYSGLDRGNEAITDGVSLKLPSGSTKSWGNLEYDVNLMIADKAWENTSTAQLYFNIFNFDGFIGDRMTVNLVDNPYFEVEARKYRFRILNASVSRFFKIAMSDGSTFQWIANDGNLLPTSLPVTELDEQGIAERYDIVVDFSKYKADPVNPTKVYFVNLCEHQDGKKPSKDLSLADALAGKSADPAVGKFLEFRVVRKPAVADASLPRTMGEFYPMIPNPVRPAIANTRIFEFGSGGSVQFGQNGPNPKSAPPPASPWGVKTDNHAMYAADFARVSAVPNFQGGTETWTLKNGGGGWDHPIHIHFEEGTIKTRNGAAANVPPWERGRKDVYRLRPSGTLTLDIQFRDWGGMFMEHCHNTVHEDNAMLVRWEIDNSGAPFVRTLPTPAPTPNGVNFFTATKQYIEPTACPGQVNCGVTTLP
jgi:FtsP/CotA-like multicopper oxidase with cupredoxin domain